MDVPRAVAKGGAHEHGDAEEQGHEHYIHQKAGPGEFLNLVYFQIYVRVERYAPYDKPAEEQQAGGINNGYCKSRHFADFGKTLPESVEQPYRQHEQQAHQEQMAERTEEPAVGIEHGREEAIVGGDDGPGRLVDQLEHRRIPHAHHRTSRLAERLDGVAFRGAKPRVDAAPAAVGNGVDDLQTDYEPCVSLVYTACQIPLRADVAVRVFFGDVAERRTHA